MAPALLGVASFAGRSISVRGKAKVLAYTSGALTPVASSALNTTVAAAAKLALTTAPSALTVSAVAFATQPVVAIQDASGNTRLGDSLLITVALTTGIGALSGTTVATALLGVASFAGLSINLMGN